MAQQIKPLFIFSLPRSGSTLLQRILATSPDIATTSEPWILLPLIYMSRSKGIYAEYDQRAASVGLKDFLGTLPEGSRDFTSELHDFVLRLYGRSAREGQTYFLDKSPPYSLVADRVVDMFPEGKFVFLWRNPLAVLSSLIESFGKGKWNLYRYKAELFEGLANLVSTYERQSNVHSVRYEDLILEPERTLERVYDYLELPFEPSGLSRFPDVQLQGGLGDSMGTRQYSSVNEKPLKKWKHTLSNPVRRIQGRRYLEWIGERRLTVMGYEMSRLVAELESVPMSYQYIASDIGRHAFSIAYPLVEPTILKHKLSTLPRWRKVYVHR